MCVRFFCLSISMLQKPTVYQHETFHQSYQNISLERIFFHQLRFFDLRKILTCSLFYPMAVFCENVQDCMMTRKSSKLLLGSENLPKQCYITTEARFKKFLVENFFQRHKIIFYLRHHGFSHGNSNNLKNSFIQQAVQNSSYSRLSKNNIYN